MRVPRLPGEPAAPNRRGPGAPGPPAQDRTDAKVAASVQRLQQAAGNHAVAGHLAPTPAQAQAPTPVLQRLTVSAAELDRAGDRTMLGMFGLGSSPYAVLRNTLAAYEGARRDRTPGADERQAELLTQLDLQCQSWLGGEEGKTNESRRQVVLRLRDELPAERVAISRRQAKARYYAALLGTGPAESNFKLVSDDAKAYLGDSNSPEEAGIMTYTASDYEYINPAASNDKGWVEHAVKGREGKLAPAPTPRPGGRSGGEEDIPLAAPGFGHRGGEDRTYRPSKQEQMEKTLREEGALHTAITMSALADLPPFRSFSYRGETMTDAQYASKVVPGGSTTRPHLLSTSKDVTVALGFASRNLPEGRTKIVVLWLYDHSAKDSGARDISAISVAPREYEVMIKADSPFAVRQVVKVDESGAAGASGAIAACAGAIAKTSLVERASAVYIVHAVAG